MHHKHDAKVLEKESAENTFIRIVPILFIFSSKLTI